MQIHYTLDTLHSPSAPPRIATIGFFDGVHLGHRHLIQTVVERARQQKGEAVVITFDRHPLSLLRPDLEQPLVLSSLTNKCRLLSLLNIDHLVVLPFTHELAQITASDFLKPLVAQSHLTELVLGYDNRFGKRTSLTLEEFDRMLRNEGIALYRIFPFILDDQVVSSSLIRALIRDSHFVAATKLLGRPYSFLGVVEHGAKIGRTINYPTANITPIDPHIFLPGVGIYIAEVRIDDKIYPAMAYYGMRPTVDHSQLLKLEAFLLDFKGDLYDKEVEIGFRSYLRGDQKFASIEALGAQLQRDEAATRAFFARHPLIMPILPRL